jgi:hypothetical protein
MKISIRYKIHSTLRSIDMGERPIWLKFLLLELA